ncbi:MAG: hypothetical protein O3C60_12220, partial [Planctomycetota bacterium]|nr:hypothetical protein [Planctomycetota bacterium]
CWSGFIVLSSVVAIRSAGVSPDGTWTTGQHGLKFGPNYTTAMYVMALAAPLELMPIYQR